MANPNSPELTPSILGRVATRKALLKLGLSFGLLGLASLSRIGSVPLAHAALLVSPNEQEAIDPLTLVEPPIIVGDHAVGMGSYNGRVHLFVGTEGEDDRLQFSSRGQIEQGLNLTVDPTTHQRIAFARSEADSIRPFLYFSDNEGRNYSQVGSDAIPMLSTISGIRFDYTGQMVFMDALPSDQSEPDTSQPYTIAFSPNSLEINILNREPNQQRELPSTFPIYNPDDDTYRSYSLRYLEPLEHDPGSHRWELINHTYNLQTGEDLVSNRFPGNSIWRYVFSGEPRMLLGYFDPRGDFRMVFAGELKNQANFAMGGVFDINPKNPSAMDSTTSSYIPLRGPNARGEVLIHGAALDEPTGEFVFKVDYNARDKTTGESVVGSSFESVRGVSIESHMQIPQTGMEGLRHPDGTVVLKGVNILSGERKHLMGVTQAPNGLLLVNSTPFTDQDSLSSVQWKVAQVLS